MEFPLGEHAVDWSIPHLFSAIRDGQQCYQVHGQFKPSCDSPEDLVSKTTIRTHHVTFRCFKHNPGLISQKTVKFPSSYLNNLVSLECKNEPKSPNLTTCHSGSFLPKAINPTTVMAQHQLCARGQSCASHSVSSAPDSTDFSPLLSLHFQRKPKQEIRTNPLFILRKTKRATKANHQQNQIYQRLLAAQLCSELVTFMVVYTHIRLIQNRQLCYKRKLEEAPFFLWLKRTVNKVISNLNFSSFREHFQLSCSGLNFTI